MEYNKAFFGLYEKLFLVLKDELGQKGALDIFSKVMERSLKEAYTASGFIRGKPRDFVRVVGERDKNVGLKVEFPVVKQDKIVYRFLTDPFPNLRKKAPPEKIDATYMKFKVSHLLGKEWKYATTKHFWAGDKFTEHVISKK